jgi:hypothetical protein
MEKENITLTKKTGRETSIKAVHGGTSTTVFNMEKESITLTKKPISWKRNFNQSCPWRHINDRWS